MLLELRPILGNVNCPELYTVIHGFDCKEGNRGDFPFLRKVAAIRRCLKTSH